MKKFQLNSFNLRVGSLKNYFLLVLAFASFMLPALWNGFPFIFTDSLSYLTSGIDLNAPVDRPIFYGLFTRVSNLIFEVWGLVLLQAAMVIYLLVRLSSVLLPELPRVKVLAWIIFTGLLTSAPWFIGQISADIFTACLFLTMILLLLTYEGGSLGNILLLSGMLILEICMHSGNLAIGLLFLFWTVALLLIQKKSWVFIKRYILIIFSCLLIGVMAIVSSNIIFHQGATFNRWGKVILLARILEDGPGLRYLNTICERGELKTCAALPLFNEAAQKEVEFGFTSDPELKNLVLNALLWDGGINKIGGLSEVSSEARSIILGAFLTYPAQVINAFLANSIDQLKTFSVGNQFGSTAHIAAISDFIKAQLPASYKNYVASRQYKSEVKSLINSMNPIYNFIIWISTIFLLAVLYFLRPSQLHNQVLFSAPSVRIVIISLFGFLLSNAVVTGGLSAVFDRYQSRVIWLLPAIAILLVCGGMQRSKSAVNAR